MVKINVNGEKEFWKSKTVWANVLILVAAVLTTISGDLQSGVTLTVAGVGNIILRTVTSSAMKWK